jgi:heme exporter protein C
MVLNINLFKYFNKFMVLKYLYFKLSRIQTILGGMALILLASGLIYGTFFTPLDYQQQDAYRIMYYHVPAAMISISIYACIGLCSIIFLIWRIKLYDIISKVSAPIGAMFTLVALVTGSIWGKPMWGTWWVWDARLTSELILLFLYLGLLSLRTAFAHGQKSALACALLGLVGLIDLPIIHYSVYWWNTLHQKATILKLAKPSIDSIMLAPLIVIILGVYCFYMYLLIKNSRVEILWRERHTSWVNTEIREMENARGI